MKERNISNKIFVTAVTIILLTIIFLSRNFIANMFYEKTLKNKLPITKGEKVTYYKNSLTLISKAINLNKTNADYLVLKADLLSKALNENFNNTFVVNKDEIEKLYIKAISLNPINFEYHLKLGWFYAQVKDIRAEDAIKKAINLYPVYYRNYLYFAKYYLMNKKGKEAFANMILTLYYGRNVAWYKIMEEFKNDIKDYSDFSFDERKRELAFQTLWQGPVFDFRQYGFPKINFPLGVRVYMKKAENIQVLLYKDGVLFADFQKLPSIGDFDVYEFQIDPKNADIYLDTLRIKTQPLQNIEKIEFLKKFK